MSHILDLFEKILPRSAADQTELLCETEEFYLTRFAESLIHQNIGRTDHTIWCRAVIGRKIGIAKTNVLNEEAIGKLIETAAGICHEQRDDPDFQSLVSSPKAPKTEGFVRATAKYTPLDRAQAVKTMATIAGKDKLKVSGMLQTSQTGLAVANSLGTRQEGQVTEIRVSLSASDDSGRAGFAQAFSRDADNVDLTEIAHRAVAKAQRLTNPIALESGNYTVILEPDAVADFLLFLGFLGFGGKGMVSGRSFMANKIGAKIMGDNITIGEDPFHPAIKYMSFDYEGVPRRKVMLVENGIAQGVVYDSYYAAQKEAQSTGNALPPDNKFGPYPKAMVMEPGTKSLDDIIASTEAGILITHFWYLNFVNPMLTTVTGTTRDGTFLIENGKPSAPVIDMRVNQSMLEAFNNAEVLSGERRLVPKYGVLMYVPAMKVHNFRLDKAE